MPLVVVLMNLLPRAVCLLQTHVVDVANDWQSGLHLLAFGSMLKLCVLMGCIVIMIVAATRGEYHSRSTIRVSTKEDTYNEVDQTQCKSYPL